MVFLRSCFSSLYLDLPLVIIRRAFRKKSIDMNFVWNNMIRMHHADLIVR